VTTSVLTSQASIFAKLNHIEVWDKHNLVKYVALYTQSTDVSLECNEFRNEMISQNESGVKCELC
jgi:hypothetical protein